MATKDETLKGKAKPAKTGAASQLPTQPGVAEALAASAPDNPEPAASSAPEPYRSPDPVARPQMAHNPQVHLLAFSDVTKDGEPCVTMMFDREVRLKLGQDDGGVTVRATPGLHEVPERLSTHWYLRVNQVQAYRK